MSGTLTTLGDCCRIVSGSTPDTGVSAYWGGDIYWATPKDLSELSSAYIENTPRKLTKAGLDSCSAVALPVGSVLFSSRAPIGHVAINTVPMCTNQGFKSFVPDAEKVFNKYLYYWLKANKEQLQNLGNGATFKEISKATVSAVQIFLPSLDEQHRLAAILDKADALREKRGQAIKKLDSLLQSVFLEMFGDPFANPKGWELTELRNVLEVLYRYPTFYGVDYVDEGVPVVRIGDILQSNFLDPNLLKYKRVPKSFSDKFPKTILKGGDLVMAVRGDTTGKIGYVPDLLEGSNISPNLIRISADISKIASEYLLYLLTRFPHLIKRHINDTAKKSITATNLASISIPVPPLSIQNLFASRVRKVRSLHVEFDRSMNHLEDLFGSLQQRAFKVERFKADAMQ